MTVSENSILEFKVYSKSKILEDTLLASKSVKIYHWVKKESENGRC
jgi:hypothetical protein